MITLIVDDDGAQIIDAIGREVVSDEDDPTPYIVDDDGEFIFDAIGRQLINQ